MDERLASLHYKVCVRLGIRDSIARDAIDDWLRRQKRKERDDEIAAFAAEMAGTEFDLDPELESVA